MLHPSRYGESKCISGDIEQCRTIEIPHSKSIGTVDRSIKGRAKITRTLVCLRFVFYLSHPSLPPPMLVSQTFPRSSIGSIISSRIWFGGDDSI